jgi:hypothetical protein
LAALRASRTGKRIAVVEAAAPGCRFVWDNTTPAVGDHPDSRIPPDLSHVRRVLAARRPGVVVAFGKQAAETLGRLWDGPLLVVPHPTYRVVTDRLFAAAGRILAAGLSDRVELVQCRGRYRRRPLTPTPVVIS